MNQTAFANLGTGNTQTHKIARVLKERAGLWVPMPELWKASGAMAVHSRISDLRKMGITIEHRNEHAADRKVHSFYRMIEPDPKFTGEALA